MKSAAAPRLLYIALSPPRDATSGSLLMHRHLQQLGDRVQLSVLHTEELRTGEESFFRLPARRLYDRLLRTRFNERVRAWEHTRGWFYRDGVMRDVIRQTRPDAILTVAEASLHLTVRRVARAARLPLATVFHDWTPGWPEVPASCRAEADASFRRVHRDSVASLSVCPELLAALGPHEGGAVLYPIPNPHTPISPAAPPSGPFHVLYAGVFYALYSAEVKSLCRELERTGSASLLRILGPEPRWPEDDDRLLRRLGLYGGYFKGVDFQQRVSAAPAHLVISSFAPEYEAYSRYSFPSKIPEYCRYGRPLVVWGPRYAASVAWARRTGAALVVDDPSPAALVAALRELAGNTGRQLELGRRAAEFAASDFDPARLQGIFEAGLRRALPALAAR